MTPPSKLFIYTLSLLLQPLITLLQHVEKSKDLPGPVSVAKLWLDSHCLGEGSALFSSQSQCKITSSLEMNSSVVSFIHWCCFCAQDWSSLMLKYYSYTLQTALLLSAQTWWTLPADRVHKYDSRNFISTPADKNVQIVPIGTVQKYSEADTVIVVSLAEPSSQHFTHLLSSYDL